MRYVQQRCGQEMDKTEHQTQQPEKDTDRVSNVLILVSGAVASLACLGSGIYFNTTSATGQLYELPPSFTQTWAEIIAFTINLALTQCFECLAFLHSLSLRWALLKEDRLMFNTNLRLFNSSKRHGPNAWYSNVVSAISLVLGYAATSQLFLSGSSFTAPKWNSGDVSDQIHLNTLALLVLGSVILIQSALGLWCLLFDPLATQYWSSNALNSALFAIKTNQAMHHDGRCMISASSEGRATSKTSNIFPVRPLRVQSRLKEARPAAKWIICSLWALAALAGLWFTALVLVCRNATLSYNIDDFHTPIQWTFRLLWTPSEQASHYTIDGAILYMGIGSQEEIPGGRFPFEVTLLLGLLFQVAVQALQTLGLHSAELIVVTARDEDSWRQLAKRDSGYRKVLRTSPFYVAMVSWKNIVLTIFKSFLHWLMGQCTLIHFAHYVGYSTGGQFTITMLYSRVFVYTLSAILFASFITFLAFKRPFGPQPAAWGHIPTLANLIDDWETDDHGRFWWGDKGAKGNIRHAGVSYKRSELQDIEMEAMYL